MFAAENREEFEDWPSLDIPTEKVTIAESLCKIICAATGTPIRIIVENLDGSFFNLGGSSLNAALVIVNIRECGHYISIPDLTSAQSVRLLFHSN